MSGFEFVFSLFGLVLGLALAEVLGGFGSAIQSRRKIRIGWLTPLIGYNALEVPLYLWATVLFFVVVIAAMWVPGRRSNIALLAFLASLYPLVAGTAVATGV